MQNNHRTTPWSWNIACQICTCTVQKIGIFSLNMEHEETMYICKDSKHTKKQHLNRKMKRVRKSFLVLNSSIVYSWSIHYPSCVPALTPESEVMTSTACYQVWWNSFNHQSIQTMRVKVGKYLISSVYPEDQDWDTQKS